SKPRSPMNSRFLTEREAKALLLADIAERARVTAVAASFPFGQGEANPLATHARSAVNFAPADLALLLGSFGGGGRRRGHGCSGGFGHKQKCAQKADHWISCEITLRTC